MTNHLLHHCLTAVLAAGQLRNSHIVLHAVRLLPDCFEVLAIAVVQKWVPVTL